MSPEHDQDTLPALLSTSTSKGNPAYDPNPPLTFAAPSPPADKGKGVGCSCGHECLPGEPKNDHLNKFHWNPKLFSGDGTFTWLTPVRDAVTGLLGCPFCGKAGLTSSELQTHCANIHMCNRSPVAGKRWLLSLNKTEYLLGPPTTEEGRAAIAPKLRHEVVVIVCPGRGGGPGYLREGNSIPDWFPWTQATMPPNLAKKFDHFKALPAPPAPLPPLPAPLPASVTLGALNRSKSCVNLSTPGPKSDFELWMEGGLPKSRSFTSLHVLCAAADLIEGSSSTSTPPHPAPNSTFGRTGPKTRLVPSAAGKLDEVGPSATGRTSTGGPSTSARQTVGAMTAGNATGGMGGRGVTRVEGIGQPSQVEQGPSKREVSDSAPEGPKETQKRERRDGEDE